MEFDSLYASVLFLKIKHMQAAQLVNNPLSQEFFAY